MVNSMGELSVGEFSKFTSGILNDLKKWINVLHDLKMLL
ncbi:hypothetical protein Pan110_16450 [Gimesia panareensis]|nr:hypothetical protein Pan110_16450 [Gimesia panareensis]